MSMPLIDGHGNFGSVDNDPPAAMRYTESRLKALTTDSLLEDIEAETVDYVDNFDGSQQEPTVLPSRIPQLLLNGSAGIAVGMATNIPPHNLGELIAGLLALIENPELSDRDDGSDPWPGFYGADSWSHRHQGDLPERARICDHARRGGNRDP